MVLSNAGAKKTNNMDRGKENLLPTSMFYGNNATKKLHQFLQAKKNIQATADNFKERPLPLRRKSSLFKPSPKSVRFATQKEAVDYAKKWSCFKYHVFAVEKGDAGKRQYLTATYDCFWSEYVLLTVFKRNHYEVVLPDDPCHLYFDLEFQYETNPGVDEHTVLETFIRYVCSHLKSCFGIVCTRKNILDLVSTTKKKFSRHLVFHLPGVVFLNNLCCGRFVHHVCNSLKREVRLHEDAHFISSNSKAMKENPESSQSVGVCDCLHEVDHGIPIEQLRQLVLKDAHGVDCMLCDLGVYTRYRNFRLYLSSKMNKQSPLLVSCDDQFTKSEKYSRCTSPDSFDKSVFFDSLICNTNTKVDRVQDFNCSCTPFTLKQQRTFDRHSDMKDTHAEQGYQSASPFPEIDKLVRHHIHKTGIKGWIRRWIYFSASSSLLLDIDGNRWCENIGRQHKSNHVYYVVDLKKGIFYQKCHDPECQLIDFKSTEYPIPIEVNPLFNQSDLFIDEFESSIEDLLNVSEEAELDYLISNVVEVDDNDAGSSQQRMMHVPSNTSSDIDSTFSAGSSADQSHHSGYKQTANSRSPPAENDFPLVEFDSFDELWQIP